MMKKMLSLCLAVCLLLGCALSAGAEGVSYPLDGGNEPLTILMGVEATRPTRATPTGTRPSSSRPGSRRAASTSR